MLACFTFCMSSISLKNCELAQIICFVLLYVFTYALAVQFSMIDCLSVFVDSLYIIPHSFSFVKGFFESFSSFFKLFSFVYSLQTVRTCGLPSFFKTARILYHKPIRLSIPFRNFPKKTFVFSFFSAAVSAVTVFP